MALLRRQCVGLDGPAKTLTPSYIPGSNLAMASACSTIRWFHREYVDERNDTCVLGNRSHKRSPATEGEIGPGSRILCVSERRHSPGDPKAETGHELQLADSASTPAHYEPDLRCATVLSQGQLPATLGK